MLLILRVVAVTVFIEHLSRIQHRRQDGSYGPVSFRAGLGDACPTDICYCFGQTIIQCTEMHLRRLPGFQPDPENKTYEVLDLSLNRIKEIPADAFKGLSIMHLKIANNSKKTEMRISPAAFRGLSDYLKHITIRGNNISRLHRGMFSYTPQLSSIDFQDNRILALDNGTFLGSRLLKNISLNNNNLHSLDEGSFTGLTRLQSLNLERNSISFIDTTSFKDLIHLVVLNLRFNEIRDLQPMVFSRLSNLQTLDLSNNNIPALFPPMFKGLENLKILNLARNPLMMIAKDTFSSMKELEELRLEKCKLTYFKSGVFDGLTQLDSLYLHHNFIRNLPDDLFHGLKKLNKIQLSFNQLQTLNVCALEQISSVKVIWLVGNPIECDCGMAWTALPRSAKVRGQCVSPEGVKGQEIALGSKYEVCRYKGYEDCARFQAPNDVINNHVTKSRYHRSHALQSPATSE